jgi:PIN domain nuclease of toxin-antitoxin system
MKTPTSFRLSEEARALIERISATLGISQAAVIEMAVRQLAKKEKIE